MEGSKFDPVMTDQFTPSLACCNAEMGHTCDNVDKSASSDNWVSHVIVELQSASNDEILTRSH